MVTTKINNMKTAMQELLDELKEYQLEFNIPIEVIDMCESQLNIEKEQIMEARNNGIESTLKGYTISNEEYYNQTYNK
jgi:Zn-dependent peptidase ImmA (M78 family)